MRTYTAAVVSIVIVGDVARRVARRSTDAAQQDCSSAAADAGEVPAELELFVGETRVLPSPNVARIAVGNGRLLSASVVDERDILLIANDAARPRCMYGRATVELGATTCRYGPPTCRVRRAKSWNSCQVVAT